MLSKNDVRTKLLEIIQENPGRIQTPFLYRDSHGNRCIIGEFLKRYNNIEVPPELNNLPFYHLVGAINLNFSEEVINFLETIQLLADTGQGETWDDLKRDIERL